MIFRVLDDKVQKRAPPPPPLFWIDLYNLCGPSICFPLGLVDIPHIRTVANLAPEILQYYNIM
jgi:hypothetical protein